MKCSRPGFFSALTSIEHWPPYFSILHLGLLVDMDMFRSRILFALFSSQRASTQVARSLQLHFLPPPYYSFLLYRGERGQSSTKSEIILTSFFMPHEFVKVHKNQH